MRSDALVLCGAEAVAHLGRMLPDGVSALLSFGVCGALNPSLRVGDIILGTEVCDANGKTYFADRPWLNRLNSELKKLRPKRAPVWSDGDEAAHSVAERAELFASTKCWVIDDESKAVAEIATERDLPFAILRSVSDDARTALPLAARHANHPDGRPNTAAVLAALRSNPSEILPLEKAMFDYGYAIDRLRDTYRSVGPQFCFPP